MENTSQNIPLFQQDIAYTSFNKAKTIQENEKKLYFIYNENNNRIKTKLVALNGTNETTLRTHYYLGNYEEITQGSNHFAINYIPASDGITAIVVTQNSQPSKTFFTYKDNLGSIVALTNENGDVVYKQNFDAWGRRRNTGDWTYSNITPPPSWLRGYTGHEHLPNFHLINMNGRMYAPLIARMLSPDNFVQDATFTQNFNRYSYVYNNPLKYNDPSGEFVVSSLLVGMAVGALIGAATSAAIYSIIAAFPGNSWNWNNFGRAVAMGTVGGALGGGMGALGAQLGTFGQSIGFNLLTNIASNSATTLAFGGHINFGSMVGMTVGGLVGAGIGGFTGVNGGAFKNVVAEYGFSAFKGTVTGAFGGAFNVALNHGDPNSILKDMMYGAISRSTLTTLNLLVLGPTYKPERKFGDFGTDDVVYRRGNFFWGKGGGLTIGRNMATHYKGLSEDYKLYLQFHETHHYYQQMQLGFANFYAKELYEYIKYGFLGTYKTKGTLENDAKMYGLNRVYH